MTALTARWHSATLSPAQLRYLNSRARMNIVVAGRRSFKTEGAKRRLVLSAISYGATGDGRFYACAPTHQQAKHIFWRDLKALTPSWAMRGGSERAAVSESELTIDLVNGAQIRVAGLDKPQRIEGSNWDGGVITEFGDVKADVLDEHIRPMMIRGGWIDIEGVPEGRNHYYELAEEVRKADEARARGESSPLGEVAYHHWTTEDVLHLWLGREKADAELAAARAKLDALVFDQEYRARFVSFEGRAYYAFESDVHARERVTYQPDRPLILAFDFNRSPGVCAYVQEIPADRLRWLERPQVHKAGVSAVIGEVYIPRNSNTRKVCERIIEDWGQLHRGEVWLYGDPAGGAHTSQGVEGSDWEIIKACLTPVFGVRLRDRVARSAPAVRSRLNAVNGRLRAADNTVGLVVDPRAAPMVVRDFEGVEADAAGDLRKVAGDPLTHLSDAIGYYVFERFTGGDGWTVRH